MGHKCHDVIKRRKWVGRAVYIKCTKNVRRNLPELKDIFREIQLAKEEEMEIISFLYKRRIFPGTPYYTGERGNNLEQSTSDNQASAFN